MAGKAYTMREMKALVEYLTERKAYSEIKGRKMWVEFANSKKTTRTWQSLKETFIKRILPDLHNPYYNLTVDQVRSFRQGVDVLETEKHNRLDLQPTGECSSGAPQVHSCDMKKKEPSSNNGIEAPKTSNVEEPLTIIDLDDEMEIVTGEDVITAAKIPSRNRASAETVVLENCYENVEDLQQALESPKNDEGNAKKTLKDLITYEHSGPFSPQVRALIDDFDTDTDTSDKEPVLKIDENNRLNTIENTQLDDHNIDKNQNKQDSSVSIVEASELNKITNKENSKVITDENNKLPNKASLKLKNPQNIIEANNDHTTGKKATDCQDSDITIVELHNTNDVKAEVSSKTVDNSKYLKTINEKSRNSDSTMQISGNTTSDTILPNNQEGLDGTKKNTQNEQNVANNRDMTKRENSKSRKRSSRDSRDSSDSKKKKLPDDNTSETNKEIQNVTLSVSPSVIKDIQNDDTKLKSPNTDHCDEINTDCQKNKTDSLFETLLESTPKETNKPSTNTIKDVPKNPANEHDVSLDKNPCLQSVSLFEEQFKTTQYSDSDSDDEATPAPKQSFVKEKAQIETKGPIPKKNVTHDREVLESSAGVQVKRQDINRNKSDKESTLQRERVLASIFGFANGGASTSRKRRLSHKKFHHHRRRLSKPDSNSSEWTSESDSEAYVSPPRGRRNRNTRKYLKPKSSQIFQDPEEGTLYVLFGKNIYPVVKDGKHIKSLVAYRPNSDTEIEEESYWKHKYKNEKKKLDQFKKSMYDGDIPASSNDVRSSPKPSEPPTSTKNTTTHVPQTSAVTPSVKEQPVPHQEETKQEAKDEKLVIKFATKNGAKLHLEGGWTQISSAIPQMMQLLRNEPSETSTKEIAQKIEPDVKRSSRSESIERVEISSGISTPVISPPVDPEVHEKINKIETEIFKEIEDREKEELKGTPAVTNNVTKRRVITKKMSLIRAIPVKRAKISKTDVTDSNQNIPEVEEIITKETAQQHESKQLEESKDDTIIKPISKPSATATTSKQSERVSEQSETVSIQSETVSKPNETVSEENKITPTKQTVTDQNESKDTTIKEANKEIDVIQQTKHRESLRLSKQRDISKSRSASAKSERSPSTRKSRTPKKYDTDSSAGDRVRTRRSTTKERTEPNIDFDDENVRFMLPPKPSVNKKSTKTQKKRSPENINTEHFRELTTENNSTQGYQDSDFSPMKINITKRKRKPVISRKYKNKRINRRYSYPSLIQELLTSDSNNSSYFVPLRRSQSTLNSEVYRTDSYQLLVPKQKPSFNIMAPIDETNVTTQYHTDIRHFNSISKNNSEKSSSNDLNILVEVGSSSSISLPLSPELSVVENLSISKEIIDKNNHPTLNETELHESANIMDFDEYMISEVDVSVPLMNQLCEPKQNKAKPKDSKGPVKLENRTLSESLDRRLRDLLLESSKKRKDKEVAMDVDASNVETEEKRKTKKRCSTPRKKKTVLKTKEPIDAIIEEEQVETCSYGGRYSCPPVITYVPNDDNANNCADVVLNKKKSTPRKKKDVIKVKIQKPKKKGVSNKLRESLGTVSKISTYTDSRINEIDMSGALLKVDDSGVDLIHNHSETCLLANECLENSIEFVENSESVITLNSSQSLDSELRKLFENTTQMSAELIGNSRENANTDPKSSQDDVFETPEDVYYSPVATNSSLITEDLSNSPSDPPITKPTKWFLLSEDENTNTQPANRNNTGFGSHLKQLFPITCAVPDLSTISEMSKENEDSRKTGLNDGNTGDCDSQSVF